MPPNGGWGGVAVPHEGPIPTFTGPHSYEIISTLDGRTPPRISVLMRCVGSSTGQPTSADISDRLKMNRQSSRNANIWRRWHRP